jgi:hypothetical protein
MEPLFRKAPDTERDSEPSSSKSRSTSRKKSRSPAKEVPVVEDPNFDTEEQLPVSSSLESPLHRGIVLERNRGYKDYQEALAKRISDFEYYINSLNTDTKAFSEYWMKSISSVKPERKVIVPPVRKKH